MNIEGDVMFKQIQGDRKRRRAKLSNSQRVEERSPRRRKEGRRGGGRTEGRTKVDERTDEEKHTSLSVRASSLLAEGNVINNVLVIGRK